MWATEDEDEIEFVVVVNHEQQYSIWPRAKALPLGWQATDKAGRKGECLRYIDEVWTDLRPLSLREQMGTGPGEPGPA